MLPIDKETFVQCRGIKKDGLRCSKRSVWEDYCRTHHPDKKTIPYWAGKRDLSRRELCFYDLWFLQEIVKLAKKQIPSEDLLEAWEEYQEKTEIQNVYNGLEEWYDNISEYFEDKAERIYDAMNEIDDYINELDYFETFFKLLSDAKEYDAQDIAEWDEKIEEMEGILDNIIFPSMFD